MTTIEEQLVVKKAALAEATDEKTFDRLSVEITNLEKQMSLQAAQERKAAAATEAADHAASVAEFNKELALLETLKKEIKKGEVTFFTSLHQMHLYFNSIYSQQLEATKMAERLNTRSKELGLPEVKLLRMVICNWDCTSAKNVYEAKQSILKQFDLACGHIQDAKKAGRYAPDHPDLSWYAKGFGQFWPEQPDKG